MEKLTQIKIGDEVCLVEMWDNEDGKFSPDQTTHDCRFYGFCKTVDLVNNRIFAVCDIDDEVGGWFPIYQDEKWYNKGDNVAMTTADANKYFPVIGK